MSYDLWVYAPAKPVQKQDLKRELKKQGWEIAFFAGNAFDEDCQTPILEQQGSLEPELLIGGWQVSKKTAKNLDMLVEMGCFDSLKHINDEHNFISSCPLHTASFDFGTEYDVDAQARLEAEMATEKFSALKAAKLLYTSSLYAIQSPTNFELQNAVCTAIARLSGGYVENPQDDFDEWIPE